MIQSSKIQARMFSMKKVKYFVFAAALSASVLMLSSCTGDRMEDVSMPDLSSGHVSSDNFSNGNEIIPDDSGIMSSAEDFISNVFSGIESAVG